MPNSPPTASTTSPAARSPWASSSTILRRTGSPSTSNASTTTIVLGSTYISQGRCIASGVSHALHERGETPERRGPLPGEAQDPLGHDVALDLRRAAGDGAGEAAQVPLPPRRRRRLDAERLDRAAAAVGVEPVGAQRLHHPQRRLLRGLGPEQLEDRLLGGLDPLAGLGQRPVAEQPQRLGVDHQVAEPVEHPVVVGQPPVDDDVPALVDEGVEPLGEPEPQHRPLVAERPGGDPPPLVQLADEVLGRHLDVVEEHLVEVEVVGPDDRPERPPGQPRAVGRDHQATDALVLGRLGIGADEGQDHVGVVRPRRPHLLPVHDEAVAVERRPGPQPGQVGPGVGLAHPQGGGDLGPQDRHRPPPLLLLGPEDQDRRGDDAQPLRVVAAGDVAAAELLLVDELLDERGVVAAELGRVAGQEPAGVDQLARPLPGPVRDVGRRPGPGRQRGGLLRRVLVEPGVEPPAVVLGRLVEAQVHHAASVVRAASTARAARARCSGAEPSSGSPTLARFTNSWRSFSQVNPSPPNSCTPWRATSRWQSPAAALAREAASVRRSSSSASVSAAKWTSARARSMATYMSTAMCLTAWNDPIGTPNWCRSFTWPSTMSSTRCDAPTIMAERPVTASSRARSTPAGISGPVQTRSAATAMPSRATSARWNEPSNVVSRVAARSEPGT